MCLLRRTQSPFFQQSVKSSALPVRPLIALYRSYIIPFTAPVRSDAGRSTQTAAQTAHSAWHGGGNRKSSGVQRTVMLKAPRRVCVCASFALCRRAAAASHTHTRKCLRSIRVAWRVLVRTIAAASCALDGDCVCVCVEHVLLMLRDGLLFALGWRIYAHMCLLT